MKKQKIALSTRYSQSPEELLNFMKAQGLEGIEYTINAQDSATLEQQRAPLSILAEAGVDVRHHLQFNRIDLAHKDTAKAALSLEHHKHCIDLIADSGGSYAIVHLCLGYIDKPALMSKKNAIKNLAQLVEYASAKKVSICLENLRGGLISNPENFLEFVTSTGALATVDIGHVAVSPCVLNKEVTAEEYIAAISPYTVSAHIYDLELPDPQTGTFYHKSPDTREQIEARMQEIIRSPNCDWWLIELGNPQEILRTQSFLCEIAGIERRERES